MQASNFWIMRKYNGGWYASFDIAEDSVREAQRLCDQFNKSEFDVEIKKHRDRRSLTANSYFHVLVNKLACALRISNDECKKYLVRSYGTIAEMNGIPVRITLPKGEKADDYYPYCEWIYGDESGDTYQLYKQTHVLSGAEFSRLLDGTVSECKEQNIETLSPNELERLYAQANEVYKHSDGSKATSVGTR